MLLYNDCWHEFWVHSWWPHMLWQAVTLWLVHKEMAVCLGKPVKQVRNWKETTWYENHAVRFRQSVQSESRGTRDMQLIRSVSDLSDDTAWKGVQALTPAGSRTKIWGKYLSICLSIYLSNLQQTVCPFRE